MGFQFQSQQRLPSRFAKKKSRGKTCFLYYVAVCAVVTILIVSVNNLKAMMESQKLIGELRTENFPKTRVTPNAVSPTNHTSNHESIKDLWDMHYCQQKRQRCQKLQMNRFYSFVHISKAAGSSWIKEIRPILPVLRKKNQPIFPRNTAGQEYGKLWHDKMWPDRYQLVSIRSPRHHMFSMFTFCKHGKWSKKVTEGTGFPRNNTNDMVDFEIWLDHFLNEEKDDIDRNQTDHFKCYHPANFQSRFLTSANGDGLSPMHGVWDKAEKKNIFEPDVIRAEDELATFHWVAVTDFFHASKCMLFYRMAMNDTTNPALPPASDEMLGDKWKESALNKSEEITSYLDRECRCDIVDETFIRSDIHNTHQNTARKDALRDFPTRILEKINILTRIDNEMYKSGLEQFLLDVVWTESQLKRRILCDDDLKKKEDELVYLGLNISDVYFSILKYKEQHKV